jgi:hypothetical protein
MLELQPLSGEEMTLPQADLHRAGFIDGERTLAAQILDLIDGEENAEHIEEEMVLGR